MIFKTLVTDVTKFNNIISDISKNGNDVSKIVELTKGLSKAEATLVMTESGLSEAMIAKVNAINGVTAATTVNTAVTELQEKSEEDLLLDQWLSIGADEAETVATEVNSTSKLKQIGIIDVLKLKYQQLAASIGLSTGAFTAIIAVSAVAVISLIKISKVSDEVAEKANDLGQSFKDSTSSIEDYKKKVSDLYDTINDSGSSIEEVKTARQDLLVVQDELIDKFGKEKDTINLVTQAINGQVEALDELSRAEWNDTLDEFNHEGFWENIANGIAGYENNIERAFDAYEDYEVQLNLDKLNLNTEDYKAFIQELKDA